MTESMTLEEIFSFINKTAEEIEIHSKITEIERYVSVLSSIESQEKPVFTFTSGVVDAYMG